MRYIIFAMLAVFRLHGCFCCPREEAVEPSSPNVFGPDLHVKFIGHELKGNKDHLSKSDAESAQTRDSNPNQQNTEVCPEPFGEPEPCDEVERSDVQTFLNQNEVWCMKVDPKVGQELRNKFDLDYFIPAVIPRELSETYNAMKLLGGTVLRGQFYVEINLIVLHSFDEAFIKALGSDKLQLLFDNFAINVSFDPVRDLWVFDGFVENIKDISNGASVNIEDVDGLMRLSKIEHTIHPDTLFASGRKSSDRFLVQICEDTGKVYFEKYTDTGEILYTGKQKKFANCTINRYRYDEFGAINSALDLIVKDGKTYAFTTRPVDVRTHFLESGMEMDMVVTNQDGMPFATQKIKFTKIEDKYKWEKVGDLKYDLKSSNLLKLHK